VCALLCSALSAAPLLCLQYGYNFGASDATVLVGSHLIQDVTHGGVAGYNAHTAVTFALPVATGIGLPVVMLQTGGFLSGSSVTVGYYRCPPGQTQSGVSCVDCPNGTYSAEFDSAQCSVRTVPLSPLPTHCCTCT
jgi:hypothetical protein